MEPTPQQKLHEFLKGKGLYNKDYSAFQQQFSTPEKRQKLHEFMVGKKVYSKSISDFNSQFFAAGEKKNPAGNVSQAGSGAQPIAPVAESPSNSPYQLTVTQGTASRGSEQVIGGYKNTPEENQKISETYGKAAKEDNRRADARFALVNTRERRNGDYEADAVDLRERSLSEKDKAELAGRTTVEAHRFGEEGFTNKQYQDQLWALKKDQTDLIKGVDGIDLEIEDAIGADAFGRYEKNVTEYESLKSKYDSYAKSNNTKANDYVEQLNDLQREIEDFQQHPLVQERNQMLKAAQKNIDRYKTMEADERYAGVRKMELERKANQKEADEQGKLADLAGMNTRAWTNFAAGIGRTAKNVNEMVWGEDAKATPISDFLIGLSEDAEFMYPSPSQSSRGLITDTAKWGDYEVDFKGDKIQAVRKGGKVIDMTLTDAQISEIEGLEKSKQTNWSAAPYQAANVIVDMGLMLAGAGKISKGLTAFGVGEKAAARTGVALSTAGQMSNGMYEQGLELFDGDKKKASEYSFFGSLAVGAIQNVFGMEQRLLTGRSIGATSLAATVGQMTPRQMGIEAAKIIGKEAIGEGFEEGLIEPLTTALAQYTIGGKTDLDPTEMVSNGAMGFIVGSLFAGGNVHMYEIQKSSLYNASHDPVAFGNALRAAIAKGDIQGDEDFVAQQVSRVTRIGSELSRLSPDLNQEEILDATELIDQRIEAEARLKEAKGNEPLEQRRQAEVDLLNEELNGMMAPPTEEVAEKIAENQAEENSTETKPQVTESTAPDLVQPSVQETPIAEEKVSSTSGEVEEGKVLSTDPATKSQKVVDKTVLTERAHQGAVRAETKKYIEEKGLTREVVSQAERSKQAQQMIADLGVDASVEAVRAGEVRGAMASSILVKAAKTVDDQMMASTDPAEIDYLAKKQADLIETIETEAFLGGEFNAQLAREYIESDIGWNKAKKTNDYIKQFGSISIEVEARFADIDAEMKDLRVKLAEAEKRSAVVADDAIIEAIVGEVNKQKPTKASISARGKAIAKNIRKGKLSRPGTFSAASPASLVWDAAIEIAATSVEAGSTIAEAVQKGIEHIKNSDWYKNLSSDKQRAAEQEYSDFLNEQQDTVGKLKVSKSLIRDLVAGGIRKVDDLVAGVRKAMGLEESDREIRDAISDYGKTINMSKDDISVEVRRLRRVAKLISQLEDVANKIRPLRSGLQRDKLTAEERALQKKLREEMKGLPMDEETQAHEQKTALDAQKSRLRNQIEDLTREIERSEQVRRTAKTLESDQELEDLKKKRDEVKKEHDELFKNEEFENTKRLEETKKRTRKSIEELERRIAEGDFAPKTKKPLLEDNELIQLRAEKLRIREEYDKEFYKQELLSQKGWDLAKNRMWEVWGVTRVLSASLDASFMLVQGGMLTIEHPGRAIAALKEAFNVMRSEKRSDEFIRNVKSQEWYPLAKQSGLKLTEAHASMKASEELFFGEMIDSFWNYAGLPLRAAGKQTYETWKKLNPFRATERAAVGYLDTLRILKWQEMTQHGPLAGKNFSENKEDFKSVADAINTLTGRASLGPAETLAPILTKLVFSPRNWASQLKLFSPFYAPIYFSNLTPTARKMALRTMGKFIAFNTGVMLMAAARFNDDDDDETGVEFDPRSSDFMKMKLGRKRVDFWGGKIQHVTFAARMLMDILYDVNQKMSDGGFKNKSGDVLPLGVPHKTPRKDEILILQAINKLAPSASLVYKYLRTEHAKKGIEDGYGNEYSMSDEIKDKIRPMIGSTIVDLKEEDGFDFIDAILSFLAFTGSSVNVYEDKKKQK